jgi:WD40 repeat protein
MESRRPDLNAALRPDDPRIHNELLSAIVQYLEDSGYFASALNLRDEVRHRISQTSNRGKQLLKLRSAITSGDWSQIEHLTTSLTSNSALLYCIFRQRFYELLAQGDPATALQFLSTRLREYRVHEDVPGDFDRLCLMLVDAASPSQSFQLPDVSHSTSKIIEAIDRELQLCDSPLIEIAPTEHRLLALLDHAVGFQFGLYPPPGGVSTLITDFHPAVIPSRNSVRLEDCPHVKSLAFVPGSNNLLAGSKDAIDVWSAASCERIGTLTGHCGRVWSISATEAQAATAGGDGTVRLWSLMDFSQIGVFCGHNSAVYSVNIERGGRRIVSGGYDQSIIIWDGPTQSAEASLKGHSEAVTSVIFDPSGQIVVSGGNDLTVQLWDIRSSLVTTQLAPILGEVSSLAADSTFTRILAATKDNTNRIWDLRRPDGVVLLKGHRNTAKHFVRARFGPDDKSVIGGSDNGKIFAWDAASGEVIDRIAAHPTGVFDIVWSPHGHCFASCGDDTSIMLWTPRPFNP